MFIGELGRAGGETSAARLSIWDDRDGCLRWACWMPRGVGGFLGPHRGARSRLLPTEDQGQRLDLPDAGAVVEARSWMDGVVGDLPVPLLECHP